MVALGGAYWRLWISSALSNLADGVFKVGLPLVAVSLTRSPTLIAGLTLAITLPWLLFALPAGALADRLDRRRAMIGANSARAVLLAALALTISLDVGSIWVLYAIAFAVGTTETIYDTCAQSILPQLVGREQLPRANGRLFAAELTANEFAGPPLAGFLVAAGAFAAFATPAGLWVAAIGALLLVRGSFRLPRERPATLRADIAEGLRFVLRDPVLRTIAVMVGVFNFADKAVFAVLVLYAVGPGSAMGLSEQAFGFLLTAIAAGGLVGSLAAEWAERVLGRRWTLGLGYAASALMLGFPAVTTNPFLIGAAFLLGGIGTMMVNVVLVSLRQQLAPARLLGRVNSVHRLLSWGTMPLGAVAGGLLAHWLGLPATFAVMGVLSLLLLPGLRVVTARAQVVAVK
ncbi:MFS transporter [Amycolatopsis magusensis]|uniref:MFS transporter n=1 Tax=Amycolatopsis magusensis TaxID=882444 RepID=UPI0024A908E4|nr:MFS transporter [Amycolatopsis magusensis]MDI5981637.1 MFS transporter [Amycolatopsis magusensis]